MTTRTRRSRLPKALVRAALRRPKATLLAWLMIALAVAPGVFRLRIETSTGSVLDRSGEDWSFYQSSQDRFGGDEILTVLIQGAKPFDPKALREVMSLTKYFQSLEGVRRVDSLATVPLIRSTPDGGVALGPALGNDALSSDSQREQFRRLVRADRIAPRVLVSDDGSAFALNLLLEKDAERHYDQILARVNSRTDRDVAWVSGVPVFRTETDGRTRHELETFVPVTIVLVGLLLFAIFRSIWAVAVPLLSSAAGTWVVMGAMGGTNVPLTIATVLLPSVLLALGCAYSMHLLAAGMGWSGRDLEAQLLRVALPVALSGLTTAVGFVGISVVRIDAIREVGAFGALGVLVILGAVLTGIPAFLQLRPLPSRESVLGRWLVNEAPRGLVEVIKRRNGLLAIAWLAATVLTGTGIWRINVDTDVIRWFPPNDPVRVAYKEIRDRLSGISPMNVVIKAADGASVSSTGCIRAIDQLGHALEKMPEVGRAISIADPLREIHGGFSKDPSNPLPEGGALIEQYLLLLEAKPYAHELISPDRSAANVVLRVNDNGSGALLRVKRRAEETWAKLGCAGASARATGIMYEFGRAEDEIARGQILGLLLAVGVIALLLVGIFRNGGIAVAALIPNVVPIAMVFGVMGLLGIPVDAGTVILGSLAMGMAVDDTIHVTEGFVAGREAGLKVDEALLQSYQRVLAPIVHTTIAVTLGFAVLALSNFTLTRNLGLLISSAMLLCLAADLLLLPVLLRQLGSRGEAGKAD